MADVKKSSSASGAMPQKASNQQQLQQHELKSASASSQAPVPAPPIEQLENLTLADGAVEIMTGKVKWFNPTRGFGFITPDDESQDLFVHQTSIRAEGFRSLREGELVEYTVEVGEDGRLRASSVTGPNGVFVLGAEDGGGSGFYGGNVGSSIGNNNNNGGGRGGGGFGRGRGRMGGAGGRGGGFGYGGGRCFNCNQPGHLARDCNATRAGCYTCGKQGHFARDCPNQS